MADKNVETVIQKHRAREARGFQKYGVTTERGDLSFEQWVLHLQELMDAAVYAERVLQEPDKSKAAWVELIAVSMPLRQLQAVLPWTVPYSDKLESSGEPHRYVLHCLAHLQKSIGKIADACEASDHDVFYQWPDIRKHVASLVMCALRIANVCPSGKFDLADALAEAMNGKNGGDVRQLVRYQVAPPMAAPPPACDEACCQPDQPPVPIERGPKLFVEDDARPPDAETLDQAYQRLFGVAFDPKAALRSEDQGDGVEYLMPGGVVVWASYPGGSAIYGPTAPQAAAEPGAAEPEREGLVSP